ncbi:hypothetical protein GIB67_032811 [Kingdonia uniflora]|uniref:Pentatricopeptide repeat-containing protein n=1 Tax=Kingdonia uniflora TaxID=39325 RepID=A0A7J7MWI2_9MAGN|nr:hypothetical protein GIB67_032811 [Kingdonia uniflora]
MAISSPFILKPIIRVSISSSFSSLSSHSQRLQSQSSDRNETLISTVVSVLKEQRSKSRWNFIKNLYPNGFSPTEVSQITLQIRNNPHLALRFFLWSEKKSLCKHNLASYSTIIHILARASFKTQAQTLIQTAIRVSEVDEIDDPNRPLKIFKVLTKTYRSCGSAPFVFDLLIEACLLAKRVDRAVTIVKMLRSRSIYPQIGTCNSLIKLVSQLKGANAGLEMFKNIFGFNEEFDDTNRAKVSPNVETYNMLMLSFYQEGMSEKVEQIWIEIEKFNCVPNVYSYSILIATLCDKGKMVEALRLWEEMKVKKIKPDVMAYNTLIRGFCEKTEIFKAEKLFREMKLHDIESTCLTYEYLITGYCKNGDIDPALILYKDLCRKDFRAEASTVEELIRAMCDKSRVYEGLAFLRNLTKNLDFFPSRNSYQCLMDGLCKMGKMKEALELQAEMVGKGYRPNFKVYRAFINGYLEKGNEEIATNLRKEMLDTYMEIEDD